MEQIGRYRILDELGRGATGVVYRAQDPAIGRTIAIKSIRLSDFTDEAERERLRERLFREAQSAGMLSHPNIVTIYDIAEENGMAYIFMEFVNGPPLEKMLKQHRTLLPDKDAAHHFSPNRRRARLRPQKRHRPPRYQTRQHHDPRKDGTAKITDFGVAKIVSQQMTQSGTMMGTPSYMSPEQVQGHAVDGRADQFSLAVIAYEVLTGEKPFVAEYLPTLLYHIVREDPVPPQRLNPYACRRRWKWCCARRSRKAPPIAIQPRWNLWKRSRKRQRKSQLASASAQRRSEFAHHRRRRGHASRSGSCGLCRQRVRKSTGACPQHARNAPAAHPRRRERKRQPAAQERALDAGRHWPGGPGPVRRAEVFVQSESEPVATTESPTAPSPAAPDHQPVSKPSPVGESRAADKTTQEPVKPPQTTPPESTKPETPKPPATQPETTQPETAKESETTKRAETTPPNRLRARMSTPRLAAKSPPFHLP